MGSASISASTAISWSCASRLELTLMSCSACATSDAESVRCSAAPSSSSGSSSSSASYWRRSSSVSGSGSDSADSLRKPSYAIVGPSLSSSATGSGSCAGSCSGSGSGSGRPGKASTVGGAAGSDMLGRATEQTSELGGLYCGGARSLPVSMIGVRGRARGPAREK